MPERYLTTGQSAEVARVSPAVIRQWSTRGLLKGKTVTTQQGRRKVYAMRDVLEAEKKARGNGGGSCAKRRAQSQ
jgi:DNA-binding transcriptional MerR regulator